MRSSANPNAGVQSCASSGAQERRSIQPLFTMICWIFSHFIRPRAYSILAWRTTAHLLKEDLVVAEAPTARSAHPTSPRRAGASSGYVGALGLPALNEYALDFWQRSILFL